MFSTRKKRQSNRRILSQLDDHDQDINNGGAASERQKNVIVNEGNNDLDFTVGTSKNNSATNENMVNVKTLEGCFNERIDREKSNIVDTIEDKDKIGNAILTAIDSIVAPKSELAISSINASSVRDVTSSVAANSERGEHVSIFASFKNASGNDNVQIVPSGNDETRNNIPDNVSELAVPDTRFDRQTHTHHMVTGQRTQTNRNPEFLTGRFSTPRSPPSHQHQNLSKQVSQENKIPTVEETPRNQNSDANNFTIRLADATAGIATQQQPQAVTMMKPVSENTLIFDGKNEKFEH